MDCSPERLARDYNPWTRFRSTLAVVDVALRQKYYHNDGVTSTGRSLFFNGMRASLGAGIELLSGLYQSPAIGGDWKFRLNIDCRSPSFAPGYCRVTVGVISGIRLRTYEPSVFSDRPANSDGCPLSIDFNSSPTAFSLILARAPSTALRSTALEKRSIDSRRAFAFGCSARPFLANGMAGVQR